MVFLADGKRSVDYKVKDLADGSGRIEVYYYEADGFRHGAIDYKRPMKVMVKSKVDGTYKEAIKMESRKQLVKRLCDALGIAY